MENRGLIFIPDISGFTRFVNETEIEHSRLIIQELLEIIINANKIGLHVSEIEGDAILFYRFGDSPDVKELFEQVEKMFIEFHKSLQAYEVSRFCQCKACTSAVGLTLKVISHYGEFTGYNVKNFSKLIGKDIIVAHQLLKNDIDKHEYWLVTNSIVPGIPPSDLAKWVHWNKSVKQTENGEIPFHYAQLSELKEEIKAEPFPELELQRKAEMISLTREYDTDIITLFHASGDFSYRHRWYHGVKAVEEVTHFLPRIGMRCRSIMENGDTVLFASSYSFSPERIEFSETDEKKQRSSYYILEKLGRIKTRLTINFYLKKNFINQFIFNLTEKKKMEENMKKSMVNLETLIKEIQLPVPEE